MIDGSAPPYAPHPDDHPVLEEKLDRALGEIAELKSEITESRLDNVELKVQVSGLENQVSELNEKMDQMLALLTQQQQSANSLKPS